MKTIRFAICGAGCRGSQLALDVISKLPDVVIVGVFDPYHDKAEKLCKSLVEKAGNEPKKYISYETMFDVEKPDAVLVSTSWDAHVPVAVRAMEKGIATALEVGGAYGEAECRMLIDAYERTKTPFMFMENCCFGKDELLATAMARKGAFGRIVYCHGAYMHDLRDEIAYGDVNRHYRLHEYSTRNCENYPTHDLGPIAKLVGINRGNRMVSLVSRASGAFSLSEFTEKKDDLKHLRNHSFAQGDIVETLITCENGELISLRLDTTLPSHYSREFTVRGTQGMYSQDLNMVLVDGGFEEDFEPARFNRKHINNAENYYEEYLPQMWKDMTPEKLEAGHGGMDCFEFEVFCDCLRNGKEMPIDVYDAAAWMSVSYLSEKSIQLGGASVEIPDFTNGAYKTRPIKDVIEF